MKKNIIHVFTVLFFSGIICLSFGVLAYAESNDSDTVPSREDDRDDVISTEDEDVSEPTVEELLNTDGKYYLYFSDTCPHCKAVNDFIVENDLTDQIVLKETVSSDEELVNNSNDLSKIQDYFGKTGVPFLLKDGQYWIGDSPIITALREEFDIFTTQRKDNTIYVILGSVIGIVVMVYILTKVI